MRLPLLLCSLALLVPTSAQAQRIDQLPARSAFAPAAPMMQSNAQPDLVLTSGIAAVVNDDVISTNDLKGRVKLAAFSSGLPGRTDILQKLLPRVLQTLINEKLQIQEAKRKGFGVSKKELDAAIERFAVENKIPNNDIEGLLAANNVPISAMRDQVEAGLAWRKVVMRTIRPRIDIGEDEIDAVAERLRANEGQEEYLVSEIFLPVEQPQDEEEVRALAGQLVDQLKGGAQFGAVARQFSQGLGSSTGGDLGWIQKGQLASELDVLLSTMEEGSVQDPVRSGSGYHILGLRGKRVITTAAKGSATKVSMKQAFRPFTNDIKKEVLLREANSFKNAVVSCTGLEDMVSSTFSNWRLQDLGEVDLETAPQWLVDQVKSIPVGRAGAPMATGKGALILFVCARAMDENINRDAIRVQLGTEKLSLLARRLQRNLRRDAYIDMRLK